MKKDPSGKLPSDLIWDLYMNLLKEIWEIVSALMGEAILEFIFILTLRKIATKHPFLNSLKVSEEGISWKGDRGDYRSISPSEIHRGFQSLVTHLIDLFSALTEGVINRELFPKVLPRVREAERMIYPK